jgi:hypothetical protein
MDTNHLGVDLVGDPVGADQLTRFEQLLVRASVWRMISAICSAGSAAKFSSP